MRSESQLSEIWFFSEERTAEKASISSEIRKKLESARINYKEFRAGEDWEYDKNSGEWNPPEILSTGHKVGHKGFDQWLDYFTFRINKQK